LTKTPPPSPTLRWLATACLPASGTLQAPPDGWQSLLALARRHRISGLLWKRLASCVDQVPPGVRAKLAAEARTIAAANLRSVLECERLSSALVADGLPFLFLKGLTLSQLVYHDATMKMSRDIDLLVLSEAIPAAARLLQALGYQPELPVDARVVSAWHRRAKESVWSGPNGVVLELHSRLNDNPAMMAGVTAATPARLVEVSPGIRLPTLPEPELLTYLAVHGASSAWFRLKWLADFANLLRGKTADELADIHDAMLELGAGRAGGLALLLSERLFRLPLPPELRAKLARDRATSWLVREALRQLEATVEPTERRLGTAGIHLSQLLIGHGWTFPLREGQRRLAELVKRRLITT